MQPKHLAAAALTYAVMANSKRNPHRATYRRSSSLGDGEDDDSLGFEPIPEIEACDHAVKKKQVVPVDVKSAFVTTTHSTDDAATAKTPRQAKVSAAAVRQVESRRRVRSAMEKYQHHSHRKEAHVNNSGGASVRRSSPKGTATPRKTTASNNHSMPTTTPIRTPSPTTPATAATSPPSVVTGAQPVRFKVKSKTSGTVLRFHCAPIYEDLLQNICERLGRGKSNLWNTATNYMISSDSALTIQFQDAEDDWCTLSNDDDLQDAVEASLGRKDTMVRLTVQEYGTATRVWNSLSTSFGW